MGAGGAGTAVLDGTAILFEHAVSNVEEPTLRKKGAVSSISGGKDAIKEVDSPINTF